MTTVPRLAPVLSLLLVLACDSADKSPANGSGEDVASADRASPPADTAAELLPEDAVADLQQADLSAPLEDVAAEVVADAVAPADAVAQDAADDGTDLPPSPDLASADAETESDLTFADAETESEILPSAFVLTSTDFEDGGPMQAPNVCESYQDLGESPALSWTEAPLGTLSYALTCIDPDGGNWVHWIAWNIPGDYNSLPAAVPLGALLEDGTVQGKNSFGDAGYGGPCPPPNGPHHYHFSLYALDVAALDLPQEATNPKSLASAMEGHLLGTAKLVGLYEKK